MIKENILEEAIKLAIIAHAGQVRKNGEPYILHPLRVMARFDNELMRAAAVLHDSVEDSGGLVNIKMIREMFGDYVANIVDALSRRKDESYEAFIDRAGMNVLARPIKIEDIRDNMDILALPELHDHDLKRIQKYHKAWKRLHNLP